MSLIPFLFDSSSSLLDQHFGLGVDLDNFFPFHPSIHRHYIRPWRSLARSAPNHDFGSKITQGKGKYRVCLDVQHFAPGEITVKTIGRQIVVEGKHEEREDEHGLVFRHFIRKYVLPEGYEPEDVVSTLSSDGVLSVSAPKKVDSVQEEERHVPITHTGPAHKSGNQSTQESKDDSNIEK